jgi:hypothetical protein
LVLAYAFLGESLSFSLLWTRRIKGSLWRSFKGRENSEIALAGIAIDPQK